MTTLQFLQSLFGECEAGQLTIWRKRDKHTLWFDVGDLESAAAQALSASRDSDIYFGVGLRRENLGPEHRGCEADVIAIPGFWIDIDIRDDAAHTQSALPPSDAAALSLLEPSCIPWLPTIVVHSGHGLQAYWLFKEPWFLDTDEERARAKAACQRFEQFVHAKAAERGWRLDSVCDLARVLRLPGTRNLKTEPVPVRILEHDHERRYNPDDFDQVLGGSPIDDEEATDGPGRPSAPWARDAASTKVSTLPPPSLKPILSGCAWLRHCLDDAQSLTEPEWYAALGIVGRCENGREAAHAWSKPYPSYSFEETGRKVDHALDASGPLKCSTIERKFGSTWCSACSLRGHIASPITIGHHRDPEARLLKLVEAVLKKQDEEYRGPIVSEAAPGAEDTDPNAEEGAEASGDSRASEPSQEAASSTKRPYKQLVNIIRQKELYKLAAVRLCSALVFDPVTLNVLAGAALEALGFADLLASVLHHQGDRFAKDAGRVLHVYQGGRYNADGRSFIDQRVKELVTRWRLTKEWSSRRIEQVSEYILASAERLWEAPPLEFLNLQNGILEWKTGILWDHDPSYLSSVQLPIKYDPKAICPAWEKFASEVLPKDAQHLFWEVAAWFMVPYMGLQKALLLMSSGGSGKSTLLAGLTSFLGNTNCAAIPLQKLESDRFAASGLVGKLANIAADIPSAHLVGTSVFKAITGGDEIHGEHKYKDIFKFRPFVRLAFSCNKPPETGDSSEGFWQRWVVVQFPQIFRNTKEERRREELDAELAQPQELSGLLNQALRVLPQVLERGITQSASMRTAADEFRQQSDPVTLFLDERTIDLPAGWVAKADLRRAYNDWAAKKGVAAETDKSFTQAFHRARPGIQDGQPTQGGRRVHAWLGIGLRATGPTDPTDPTDPPGPPAPPDAQHAQDAQVNPIFYQSQGGSVGGLDGDGVEVSKDEENPVHGVQPVQELNPAAGLTRSRPPRGDGTPTGRLCANGEEELEW